MLNVFISSDNQSQNTPLIVCFFLKESILVRKPRGKFAITY
nr:MAG TPA: hypothetical protein [Caudoviricetes sp.]